MSGRKVICILLSLFVANLICINQVLAQDGNIGIDIGSLNKDNMAQMVQNTVNQIKKAAASANANKEAKPEEKVDEVEKKAEETVEEKVEEKDEDEADLTDDGPYVEKGVLVLEDSNFDEVVNSKDLILVEFYAPWCGHCKNLAPHYEAAARRLKENDPPVALAKVDATTERDIAGRYDISGYPTLKYFLKGQVFDYEGPREEEGIVQFMQERANPNWKPPPEAVITLTEGNFSEVVDEQDLMLVEFYAPWCGHCKRIAPELEKAAQILKKVDPPIIVAKVDATAEKEIASKFGVTGYPDIRVFRKGKAFAFKGSRESHGIVSYMKNQLGDGSKELKTLKELQKNLNEEDITLIGFFADEKDPGFENYMDIANDMRDNFEFRHTFDKAARENYKLNSGSLVIFMAERFHTKYEPKFHRFEIKADTALPDITEFIEKHTVPLVGHMNHKTKAKRYDPIRPLVLFFYTVSFDFDHKKVTQMWRQKIAAVASKFEDLTFAIADEDDYSELFQGFGFDDSGEEMNVGVLGKGDNKYPMKPMEEWDTDDIESFLKKYKKGEILPRLMSQPIPKKQKGYVTQVVGDTFHKIVMDPKRDVLFILYAPGCGYCKKLEPIYKELAKKYKKDKHFVVARMDDNANGTPAEYESNGVPTIYFAPANAKDNPIKYEAQTRTLEELVTFVEEHATVSLGKSAKDEL